MDTAKPTAIAVEPTATAANAPPNAATDPAKERRAGAEGAMAFAAMPKIINVPASAVIPTTTPPIPDMAMRSIAAAKIVKVVATSRRTPAPLDCPLNALTATPRITREPANPAKAVPTCSMFKPDIMFKLAAMMARDVAIKGITAETWLSFFSSGIV